MGPGRGGYSYVVTRIGALAVAVLAGCGERRAPVIGGAFTGVTEAAALVASDQLAAETRAGAPDVRLVYDGTVANDDPADIEVRRAERLAALPGLVAVVGHNTSRGSLVAAPVYNQLGIPQVTPTSTSRRLRTAGPWTLPLCPDDSVEGRFIADFALQRLHARRLLLFFVSDEYGSGLRDGITAALATHGVTLHGAVSFDTKSDLAVLVEAALGHGRPDAIVVAGRAEEAAVIARLAWARYPGIRTILGDGALYAPVIRDSAGAAADSIYGVGFWWADTARGDTRAFVDRFRRLAGRAPGSGDALRHDAIMVLARAIRAVGPDRAAVRDYLLSLGVTRPPYPGLTGPVTFGDHRVPRILMLRLRDDDFVPAAEASF